MKKIIALFISCAFVITSSITATSTENYNIILGLDEQLDEICLSSDVNAEVRSKMQETYSEHLEYMVESVMKNPDYAKRKMGIDIGDDEYEKEQIRYMFSLDTDKGVLVSQVNTIKYSRQYAQEGCLSYLLDGGKVFRVPGKVHDCRTFTRDGIYLTYNDLKNVTKEIPLVVNTDDIINYLNNRDVLKNELIQKGETFVYDVQVYGSGYLTFMHIKCDKSDYLVKLYDSGDEIIPSIARYKVYSTAEIMDAFNTEEVRNSLYSGEAKLILAEKPTFEAEALNLQEDGLLYGNENGLDLLKPLTRIEAATMLLRALGKSTVNEGKEQTFKDVPKTHWGYGAAENAYMLGLIKGIGEALFAPDEPVTGAQFATMVLRAGRYSDFNWEEALDMLVTEGIISAEDVSTMDFFTRGDMAKIIYEAIEKGIF